jgi:hypothetical protein
MAERPPEPRLHFVQGLTFPPYDFAAMIRQQQYADTLFIYNENEQDYASGSVAAGGGNAAIRPFRADPGQTRRLNARDPSRGVALGIPTGSHGIGYQALTRNVTVQIDAAIERIRLYVARANGIRRVVFSANAADSLIGTGIFQVGEAICEYITDGLRSVAAGQPRTANAAGWGFSATAIARNLSVQDWQFNLCSTYQTNSDFMVPFLHDVAGHPPGTGGYRFDRPAGWGQAVQAYQASLSQRQLVMLQASFRPSGYMDADTQEQWMEVNGAEWIWNQVLQAYIQQTRNWYNRQFLGVRGDAVRPQAIDIRPAVRADRAAVDLADQRQASAATIQEATNAAAEAIANRRRAVEAAVVRAADEARAAEEDRQAQQILRNLAETQRQHRVQQNAELTAQRLQAELAARQQAALAREQELQRQAELAARQRREQQAALEREHQQQRQAAAEARRVANAARQARARQQQQEREQQRVLQEQAAAAQRANDAARLRQIQQQEAAVRQTGEADRARIAEAERQASERAAQQAAQLRQVRQAQQQQWRAESARAAARIAHIPQSGTMNRVSTSATAASSSRSSRGTSGAGGSGGTGGGGAGGAGGAGSAASAGAVKRLLPRLGARRTAISRLISAGAGGRALKTRV